VSTEMNPTTGLCVDLFGPMVELLTSPQEASIDFCVLRGVIPRVSVPLHSHPDTEDFFVISGEAQAQPRVLRARRPYPQNMVTGTPLPKRTLRRETFLN
jgi:hypothetical protein